MPGSYSPEPVHDDPGRNFAEVDAPERTEAAEETDERKSQVLISGPELAVVLGNTRMQDVYRNRPGLEERVEAHARWGHKAYVRHTALECVNAWADGKPCRHSERFPVSVRSIG